MKQLKKFSAIIVSLILSAMTFAHASSGKEYNIFSPDGEINIHVYAGHTITWSVTKGQTRVIDASDISLTLENGEVLGKNVKVLKSKKLSVNNVDPSPFYKKSEVVDNYNSLDLLFKGSFGVEFRAYNDGIAYRFYTKRKGEITVADEQAEFNFDKDYKAFVPYINDNRSGERYCVSFESFYDVVKLSEVFTDSLSLNPILVDLENSRKAAIVESDVEDYPAMYLKANAGKTGFVAEFAPYPLEGVWEGYHTINFIPTKRADYIAKTSGTRTFPWRAVVISDSDKELANSDMAYKLASKSRIEDMSWIKPGKVAWEWWNGINISHVDFKAGINNETYKYFIDFAAANNLEYMLIDAGWTVGGNVDAGNCDYNASLLNVIPEINIPELVEYGKERNVGILLWASWMLTEKEKEVVFPYYSKMGVKGFKVDFFDSDDQAVMQSAFDIARVAAENHLLLDYHGFHATGLTRTYPNIVNIEGVKGQENLRWTVVVDDKPIWDQPQYAVQVPFIRMIAGPLEYTPGAMRNAIRSRFRKVYDEPMSQGTRVNQIAMYVIYEAPLQMLVDSPTVYMKEQECTDFIAQIPTVFDETIALDGEVGEYVAIARRKGDTWYIGAMTNWAEREIELDLSFLGSGSHSAEIFKDGVNADRQATDYKKVTTTVSSTDKITVKMAPGGGWAAIIR